MEYATFHCVFHGLYHRLKWSIVIFRYYFSRVIKISWEESFSGLFNLESSLIYSCGKLKKCLATYFHTRRRAVFLVSVLLPCFAAYCKFKNRQKNLSLFWSLWKAPKNRSVTVSLLRGCNYEYVSRHLFEAVYEKIIKVMWMQGWNWKYYWG